MERTKYFLMLFFFFGSMAYSSIDYKKIIYKAYVTNDMASWKAVLNLMDKEPTKSNAFVLEHLNYQYGYVAWCLGNKKEYEARKYLDLMWENIDLLEKRSYMLSYVYAYKAAAYGFEVALNTFYAPIYGPKGFSAAEKAIELDRMNPFAYMQLANAKFFAPGAFGGSKTIAIENYLKALSLMEKKPAEMVQNWNYLNLLVAIAKAYEETEQYGLAKFYYERILQVEPQFTWVKNELYPALLKKIESL